jgi:hypothetical protein
MPVSNIIVVVAVDKADDLHFLRWRNTVGVEISNHFKYIAKNSRSPSFSLAWVLRRGACSRKGRLIGLADPGFSGQEVAMSARGEGYTLEADGLTIPARVADREVPIIEPPDRLAAAELLVVVDGDELMPAPVQFVER